jgi:hypothetical protein
MVLVIGQNKRSTTLQGRAPVYNGSGTRLKPRTTFLAGHPCSATLHLILVVRPFRVAQHGAKVTRRILRFLRESGEAWHYEIATGFALAMTKGNGARLKPPDEAWHYEIATGFARNDKRKWHAAKAWHYEIATLRIRFARNDRRGQLAMTPFLLGHCEAC